ncbi:MAG: type II toxin-antitoxin system VapC family toxin [Hormoscilla sp. GM102CHS1]|nr:type II toxin-antitoxin system VapC family toxin [Hormoscilla sp. GM102CHS1]
MKIMLDSNIFIALVISLPYSQAAIDKMAEWEQQNVELLVPTLWSYEVASTLRKAVATRSISSEEAVEDLQDLLSMNISFPRLCLGTGSGGCDANMHPIYIDGLTP